MTLLPPALLLMILQGGWQAMPAPQAIHLALAAAVGVVAYYTLTRALRIGAIPVVAPFRYTRLIFALAIGFLVFAERPDAPILIGSALIIATGIYAIYRERLRLRQSGANPG